MISSIVAEKDGDSGLCWPRNHTKGTKWVKSFFVATLLSFSGCRDSVRKQERETEERHIQTENLQKEETFEYSRARLNGISGRAIVLVVRVDFLCDLYEERVAFSEEKRIYVGIRFVELGAAGSHEKLS